MLQSTAVNNPDIAEMYAAQIYILECICVLSRVLLLQLYIK